MVIFPDIQQVVFYSDWPVLPITMIGSSNDFQFYDNDFQTLCLSMVSTESFKAHFNLKTNFFFFFHMQMFDIVYSTLVAEFNEQKALKKSSKNGFLFTEWETSNGLAGIMRNFFSLSPLLF